MGIAVLEPWFFCHRHGRSLASCLPFKFSLCIPGTILWEPLCRIYGFACHQQGKMMDPLLAFQLLSLHSRHDTMGATVSESWLCSSPSQQNDGPNYRPILDTSAWRLACCHHSCSARYCNVRPSTGGQPVNVFRFAALILIRIECSYTNHALLKIAERLNTLLSVIKGLRTECPILVVVV